MTNLVWIECQELGCPNGIGVHWKHARNFEGRFWCPEHPILDEHTGEPA